MGEPPHVHERERNALLAPAADQLTCPQRSPAQPGWHSQPPETQSPLKPAQSAAVEQAAGIFRRDAWEVACADNVGRMTGWLLGGFTRCEREQSSQIAVDRYGTHGGPPGRVILAQ